MNESELGEFIKRLKSETQPYYEKYIFNKIPLPKYLIIAIYPLIFVALIVISSIISNEVEHISFWFISLILLGHIIPLIMALKLSNSFIIIAKDVYPHIQWTDKQYKTFFNKYGHFLFNNRNMILSGIFITLGVKLGWLFMGFWYESAFPTVICIIANISQTFLMAIIFWYALALAIMIRALSKEKIIIDPYAQKETGVPFIIGKTMLKAVLLLTAGILFSYVPGVLSPWENMTDVIFEVHGYDFLSIYLPFIVLILVGIFTILFFLYPQYQVHKMLTSKKKGMLDDLTEKIKNKSKLLMKKKDMNIKEANELITFKILHQEVSKMPEWTFDLKTIIRVVGASVAPVITFLIKILKVVS